MAVVWVLIWLATSASAYYLTKAAFLCCCRPAWDKPTAEFIIICSIFLGPVFLIVSAELLLLAAIGTGLSINKTRRYKDS